MGQFGMAKRASGRAAVENLQTFFLTRPALAANQSLVKTTYTSVGERSLPFRAAFAPITQRAAYHQQMPHAAY